MKKVTILMAAAVMALSVTACAGEYKACDYPREQHEAWQHHECDGEVMKSDKRVVRTFNRSLEK